jgi:hypothetical protein
MERFVPACLILPLALGCADAPDLAATAIQTHAVQRGARSPLILRTPPAASCTLGADGQPPLPLFADDAGRARVYVTTDAPAGVTVPLTLACTTPAGAVAQTRVELRPGDAPLVAPPSPPSPGTQQLALGGEADTLTNAELLARGYPPRPDRTHSPAAYAEWHRIVSQPFTLASARTVELGDRRYGGSDGSLNLIWSGAEIVNPHPTPKYVKVMGTWRVPAIVVGPPVAESPAVAAEWIGIDNKSGDIEQSGTDSVSHSSDIIIGTRHYTISVERYYAWTETFPARPRVLTNFPVSPGDELWEYVYLGDGNGTYWPSRDGTLDPRNNTVWYYGTNRTTGSVYLNHDPLPSTYSGDSVEFIIERQHGLALGDFDTASMYDIEYGDSAGTTSGLFWDGAHVSAPGDAVVDDLTMFRQGDFLCVATLSQVGPFNSSTVTWTWLNSL